MKTFWKILSVVFLFENGLGKTLQIKIEFDDIVKLLPLLSNYQQKTAVRRWDDGVPNPPPLRAPIANGGANMEPAINFAQPSSFGPPAAFAPPIPIAVGPQLGFGPLPGYGLPVQQYGLNQKPNYPGNYFDHRYNNPYHPEDDVAPQENKDEEVRNILGGSGNLTIDSKNPIANKKLQEQLKLIEKQKKTDEALEKSNAIFIKDKQVTSEDELTEGGKGNDLSSSGDEVSLPRVANITKHLKLNNNVTTEVNTEDSKDDRSGFHIEQRRFVIQNSKMNEVTKNSKKRFNL